MSDLGIRPIPRLEEPRKRRIGAFGGIEYVQNDGIFSGRTSTGKFRVPYQIAAPVNPEKGNQTVLVEPPHFNIALGARVFYLGEEFLFSRGFSHAGVGWSTTSFDGREIAESLTLLCPGCSSMVVSLKKMDELTTRSSLNLPRL